MEIVLNDKYKVVTDAYNYILQKKSITGEDSKEPGVVTWKSVGWYGSLNRLVHALIDHEIKSSEVDRFIDLEALVNRIENGITERLRVVAT